jgi:hypothetical protein
MSATAHGRKLNQHDIDIDKAFARYQLRIPHSIDQQEMKTHELAAIAEYVMPPKALIWERPPSAPART